MESPGGHPMAKRGRRPKRHRPECDVEEEPTSLPITRSIAKWSASLKSLGNQPETGSGSAVQTRTRSKRNTSQSVEVNRLVCDIGGRRSPQPAKSREPLPDVTKREKCESIETIQFMPPEFTSQLNTEFSRLADAQKKASEENAKWLRHEWRSFCDEKKNLRLNVILQLEAALNSVDEVEQCFSNCCKESTATKNSFNGLKDNLDKCLQQVRRFNSETPVVTMDLQRTCSSAAQDSSEKLKPLHTSGKRQNHIGSAVPTCTLPSKVSTGASKDFANCVVECSPLSQPAQFKHPFQDGANRGSPNSAPREILFRKVDEVIGDKLISYRDKIPILHHILSCFLDVQDNAITNLTEKCRSLREEKEVLQRRIHEEVNLTSKAVSQSFIAQFEAAQKFVEEVERGMEHSSREHKATKKYWYRVKSDINNSLQQIKGHLQQSASECHESSEKSNRRHGNGDEQIYGISGSYSDDGATPNLLQIALSNARVAVSRLQRIFSEFKNSRQVKTGGSQTLEGVLDVFFARPSHSSYYIKSTLNRLLFEGFENESFNTSLGISQFPNPNLRQRNFYQYYLRTRECNDMDDIEDPQFKEFFETKLSSLLLEISPDCHSRRTEVRCLDELGNSLLASSFRNATRSVWLLHKLAFSFESPAAIFRVGVGTDVDPEYMEAVVSLDDNDRLVDKVGFMVAPGLRLRNTVIPSEVYLTCKCE
ncbi:unnamed protein product [Calypogeia fissa]